MSEWFKLLRELFRNLNQLRPHIRPNRWLVITALITATSSAAFEGVGIGLLLPLINMLDGDPQAVLAGVIRRIFKTDLPPWLAGFSNVQYVAAFCGMVFLTVALKNGLLYFNQRLMAAISRRISQNLRASLFEHLHRASLGVFEQRKSGEIGHAYSMEAVRAQMTVENLLFIIQRSFLALFYLAFITIISWQFMMGVLVLGAVVAFAGSRVHLRLRGRGEQKRKSQRELFAFVTSSFNGVRVVRANNALPGMRKAFDQMNWEVAEADRRGTLLSNALMPISETIALAGAMLLLVGAYGLLIQQGKLGATQLMLIGFVLIRTLPLMNQISAMFGQLTFNSSGVREALRWLQTPTFPSHPFGKKPFEGLRHSIQFEKLGFKFPNGKEALIDIDLKIPAGKTVALVGASGSGKTTLASLLLRLREPSSGRIVVDGTDYWEFTPEAWHSRIGMVEQEAFLFNDTIENNIRFGCPNATKEDIAKAIRIAHLEEVIAGLSDGLKTMVGERGTMLSGGQKQRVAIARALVRDPMLLVLDEATSALDNESERQVQAALDAARTGRTSVVIAHRLTTVRNADLIVVLDQGRVVEQGTWAELAPKGGYFTRLLEAAQKGRLE
ncbi:MAG: ABC transporter ATP-binding protein [Verrucomicrobia bacterium]|nr:ABC transporter ATP-binding protein [Verrucomicrobiota bacterium]